MMTAYDPDCQTVACWATFTVDGQRGQPDLAGGTVVLQADDLSAEKYNWEVTSSPARVRYKLTGALQPQARLFLPYPGVYIVQLTISKGGCVKQEQQTLWVATPGGGLPLPPPEECCLSDDDRAAIEHAAGIPEKDNPFVAETRLADFGREHFLSQEDKEAIEQAQGRPNGQNPFVTTQQLADFGRENLLSQDDKEAIEQAEGKPGGQNPFVTSQQLDKLLTRAQREALREEREHPPTQANPFVTQEELNAQIPASELTENQKQALREDRGHPPTQLNPFITYEELKAEIPPPELTENLKDALLREREHLPSRDNYFVTYEELQAEIPSPELTENQKQALQEIREHPPTSTNPFITYEETKALIPKSGLSENQQAALHEEREHPPTQTNYFVTYEELKAEISPLELTDNQRQALHEAREHPPTQGNPFITQEELEAQLPLPEFTGNQKQALREEREHPPTQLNPFVTYEETQALIPPPELTENQKQALKEARTHPPTQLNPFVTYEELKAEIPPPELTDNQRQALHEAREQPPTTLNPFVTKEELKAEIPPPELTDNQKQALREARTYSPTQLNPFVTYQELKAEIPPPELTDNQKQALREDRPDPPTFDNYVVTQAQLAGISTPAYRTIAAGNLDLRRVTPEGAWGGLKVVDRGLGQGQALLSFSGYRPERKHCYIVKALPVHQAARPKAYVVVQLVEFNKNGFVLQMIQPDVQENGSYALGPCMIEVSEIVANLPEPVEPALEAAIRDYYHLYIAAGRYAEAYPMLSTTLKNAQGLNTLAAYESLWQNSGPATLIGYEPITIEENQATVTLELDYRQLEAIQRVQYGLVRDMQQGHSRFGYWLLEKETVLERSYKPQGPFREVWGNLNETKRNQLGEAETPLLDQRHFTLQRFEGGLMLWFNYPDPARQRIWVLQNPAPNFMRGSQWQDYADDWPETAELYSCDQARNNGPLGPVRNFGWVWCRNQEVRRALDQPDTPESGSGDQPPYGSVQFFQGGLMFYRPKRENDRLNNTNQVFVLYKEDDWRRFDL